MARFSEKGGVPEAYGFWVGLRRVNGKKDISPGVKQH